MLSQFDFVTASAVLFPKNSPVLVLGPVEYCCIAKPQKCVISIS